MLPRRACYTVRAHLKSTDPPLPSYGFVHARDPELYPPLRPPFLVFLALHVHTGYRLIPRRTTPVSTYVCIVLLLPCVCSCLRFACERPYARVARICLCLLAYNCTYIHELPPGVRPPFAFFIDATTALACFRLRLGLLQQRRSHACGSAPPFYASLCPFSCIR
ncbi:hypothetical protein PLICRDRAFT_295872 [Plicaturopsis crispa FD-325 SS-3]|nr:hypothetical protein PLICRDRAFT_295872 [Plicaturopsis crispa FD-325 SS-3]